MSNDNDYYSCYLLMSIYYMLGNVQIILSHLVIITSRDKHYYYTWFIVKETEY